MNSGPGMGYGMGMGSGPYGYGPFGGNGSSRGYGGEYGMMGGGSPEEIREQVMRRMQEEMRYVMPSGFTQRYESDYAGMGQKWSMPTQSKKSAMKSTVKGKKGKKKVSKKSSKNPYFAF